MIEWLTADAGAANWAVVLLVLAATTWAVVAGVTLIRIGELRQELGEVESHWREAEGNERIIRERLARARAALDGKDGAA